MTDAKTHTEDWKTLPWKKYRREVYRLQKRIYRASLRGDRKQVHNLQRLLLRSWSARCLAIRQVSQDNRGKRTAGVDGIANLTPKQRLAYAQRLGKLKAKADPVRRVYIQKPNNPAEKRPLGIPTMFQRGLQALVKLALEPEWEARFEPNSYGFRPGRCAQDAIEAIFICIGKHPKYALDADIEKCFDRIDHQALVAKLKTIHPIERLVRNWLKAGVMDEGKMIFPEAGTPQGGVASPLLANVALHGLEQHLAEVCTHTKAPLVVRYADDLVVLHEDLDTLLELTGHAENWLREIGLQFKVSKTRLCHTLEEREGQVGFDFLGFTVRQYRVGKHRTHTYRGKPGFKTIIKPSQKAQKRHLAKIREIIRKHRGQAQAALIAELNPLIRGWANYYQACVAKRAFSRADAQIYQKLAQWAAFRHPDKGAKWRYLRYWKRTNGRIDFSDGAAVLTKHADTKIHRHIKVRGRKSPFDGDWLYWSARLGRDPNKPPKIAKLLKRQEGKCLYCGLRFRAEDVPEIHHRDRNRSNYAYSNLALLHGHCHDQIHSEKVFL
ncbi:MAG TPA: group II intron reverse transcriptase/maturase [Anaerolineales bacterium]|nr:group II intron reverse transcriptase/maturase [Anaerolineales bacterium]